ncbi:MAG: branched-chain-amino-acid transaminase [Candidatus Omnitrophica bacterium]|nr:branched-chain-amino-acid transaminase [Candidatus Omnitrophota bacterium]
MEKIWLNGKMVDGVKARISVFDRGFMYGDGLFETMRSYAGVVFRLDAHINRFYTSLAVLGIKPPYGKKTIKAAIYKLLKVNRLKSAYIKVIVTRGEGRFGISHKDTFRPNTVIVTKDFEDYPTWMFEKGISAEIIGSIRQNEMSILSRVKSLNFLPYIMARFAAKDMGYDEAILTNTKGHIAEAATSNIFLVKEGALITPSLFSGILPGITRTTVLEIARNLKIGVREKTVFREDLLSADEVFITNSLAEIIPVTRIGCHKIGSGRPGEITKLLRICYQKQVIREILR